jgi:uroporphyrinogen III methyltransferase / synthase
MAKPGYRRRDDKKIVFCGPPHQHPIRPEPTGLMKGYLSRPSGRGKVFLVGAGPGDVGLLTLRARECIARADVIVHDSLVNPVILGWAREDAEIINMGKRGTGGHVNQEGITGTVIEHSLQGKAVVRLKGGDPFIFGRGAEEAQALARLSIPFEVVPGVTAAGAVAAYGGIPLTHRDLVSQATLITGHPDSRIRWDRIGPATGTLVVYMGLSNLPHITEMLIKGGWSPDTPAAVISRGTLGDQKVLTASLLHVFEETKRELLTTPALVIIGQVVDLRDTLRWFEDKPLFGCRILITGSKTQSFALARTLEGLGALSIMLPVFRVIRPDSWEELDHALENLGSYDYLIFPSINSVTFFFRRFSEKGKDIRELVTLGIGALGENTVNALSRRLLKVDLSAPNGGVEDFSAIIRAERIQGKRILIPGHRGSRGQVARILREMGNEVIIADTYRIVDEEIDVHQLRKVLRTPGIDLAIFTSPVAVRNFCAVTRGEPWESMVKSLKIATVGPLTAKEAIFSGLTPSVIPRHFTVSGLVSEIVEKMGHGRGSLPNAEPALEEAAIR